MDVEDTDPKFTAELNKPLNSVKRTFSKAFENEVKDDEATKAITSQTRHEILHIATLLTKTDPSKYLPVLEKVNSMTEEEAKLYLQCLKASVNYETYGAISSRIIEALAEWVCHPSDDETKIEMLSDTTLENLISQEVGSLMMKAGKAAVLLLISFYGITSWSKVRFQLFQPIKRGTARAPFSNDGGSEEQDGQIDVDGETNDNKMDQLVQ